MVTSALKQHECGCEDIAMTDALRGFVRTLSSVALPHHHLDIMLTAFIYQYTNYRRNSTVHASTI